MCFWEVRVWQSLSCQKKFKLFFSDTQKCNEDKSLQCIHKKLEYFSKKKESIEEQTKIQDELRIKFMDFFVDKGILNYIEPPPEKLEEMEEA